MTALLTGLLNSLRGFVLKRLWSLADTAIKDIIAKNHWESHIKTVLADYEKVIEEAKVKASDGLTEEEKNEIRQKKTDLEKLLINGPAD